MIKQIIFERHLDLLASEVVSGLPPPQPLPADGWISRSVLQKAIRRGNEHLALSAGRQLFLTDKRTLWRRLTVTALEDLGPTESETLGMIVAAWRSPKWRSGLGDWPVLARLIQRACQGSRNQVVNDLHTFAVHGAGPAREAALDYSRDEHLEVAANTSLDLVARAVSALTLVGAGPIQLPEEPPTPNTLFEVLGALPDGGGEVCREAFRLTREPLAALFPLIPREDGVQLIASSQPLPDENWIGPVPTYALDQYTRPGRAAIRAYIRASEAWQVFAEDHRLPRGQWSEIVGEILFRVEGAVITNWSATPIGGSLARAAMDIGCGLPPVAVGEAKSLLRRQLPHIDDFRRATFPNE